MPNISFTLPSSILMSTGTGGTSGNGSTTKTGQWLSDQMTRLNKNTCLLVKSGRATNSWICYMFDISTSPLYVAFNWNSMLLGIQNPPQLYDTFPYLLTSGSATNLQEINWSSYNKLLWSGTPSTVGSITYQVVPSSLTDFYNKDMILYCKNVSEIKLNDEGVVYNWQSVPSISGKNGILQSLVRIKESALNDGEPVSGASVTSFDSLGNINIPNVIDEQMPVDPSDVTSVTATYLIPALEDGTYEGIKLLVKKNSIPTSEEDADKVIDLSEPTSILRIDSKSVGNLDEDSHYYFMIKLVDEIGTEATSDPKDIWTSHSEGYNFDYTGSIQTFVAPKTGIYQLETWGAQGGDATDGEIVARGGYGAYAVGEVLLQQGDTLYINVGGQNGYGGGGNYTPPNNE